VPKKTLRSSVSEENENLSQPVVLRGSNLDQFASTQNLGLIERATAFGMNTAAMYGLKNADLELKAPLAILLRLYGAFPETLPRMWTPSFTEFILLVQKAEPGFKEYSAGPLLGIDKNSIYRIRNEGFDVCKESTKILVTTIYRLLKEDLSNWSVIKDAVQVEASSRGLDPEQIWKKGKWKNPASDTEKVKQTEETKKPTSTRKIRKVAVPQSDKGHSITKPIVWKN
jgi:hypothetical protein